MKSRRDFLTNVFGLGAGLATLPSLSAAQKNGSVQSLQKSQQRGGAAGTGADAGSAKAAWRMVDGVKEFRLIAEPVRTELCPGQGWTCGASTAASPVPRFEVNEGDRVRIIFENQLPEMTALHWHGLGSADGDGRQPWAWARTRLPPGGQFTYEFTLNQHGTLFLSLAFCDAGNDGHDRHVHRASEDAVCAARGPRLRADHQEWPMLPNNTCPNTHGDGVQLADVQRQSGAGDDADAGAARRARAHRGW